MPEYSGRARSLRWNWGFGWFVGLELLCAGSFVVLLAMGQSRLAAAVLLGPFQLIFWCAIMRNSQSVLMAFCALLPLAGASLLPYAYDRNVYLPGTVLLLCMQLFTRHLSADEPERVRLRVSEWFPLFALGTWTVASGLNAVAHGWGWKFLQVMTLVAVQVMVLAYFFATVPRSLADVRKLLYTVLVTTVFVALCIPFLPSASGGVGSLGGKMVATPFGDVNLNTIGYVVGPLAAVALGMAVGSRRRRTKLWLGAAAFVCATMLVLTKSRGAWLGFGAALLYIMATRRSLAVIVAAASAGLVAILSDVLRALLVSRAAATSLRDPSLLGRFQVWDYALRVGKANWLLGVGMENYRYVKQFYGYPLPLKIGIDFNAHNIFLEMFVDLGVVGLAVFLWLLASSFSRAAKATRFVDADDLGLGLSAGIVAYSAHGLFDCVLFMPGVFALLGLFIGLSVSIGRLAAVTSATRPDYAPSLTK